VALGQPEQCAAPHVGRSGLRGCQRRLQTVPCRAFPSADSRHQGGGSFSQGAAGGVRIRARRIAIAESSAGAHLAALVGVSNGNRDLEGTVGGHLDQSADVQAIVSFYGASNLTTILEQSTPKGLAVRIPALQLLLGDLPDKAPELARLASPVFHVDANDPPLLLLHGNHDPQMPISQSQELHGNYEESGLPVRFVVVHGAAHSGKQFYDEQRTATVARFLTEVLRPGLGSATRLAPAGTP
jgi:acetyl esterase/lipase